MADKRPETSILEKFAKIELSPEEEARMYEELAHDLDDVEASFDSAEYEAYMERFLEEERLAQLAEEEALEQLVRRERFHREIEARAREEADLWPELTPYEEEPFDACEGDPDDFECQQNRYNPW
jgi:hypothetical protein